MDIQIVINNPNENVIRAIADVVGNYDKQTVTATLASAATREPAATPTSDTSGQASESDQETSAQSDKPKRQRKQQDKPADAPAPAPAPEPEPDSEEEPQQDSQADVPTVVELRAKAQEVGSTPEAKKAIKALLDKFGSKSISDIPEDKRADFMAELDLV
jgi:predicted lipid-binding transport protein (Tim44 family)